MRQGNERIRIFVSSTFQDMQAERDAIRNFILPPIQEKAEWSGRQVELCDLRWGINTDKISEEDANRKILSICLSEIEDCKPYMLVLVGERYGWKPGTDLLQLALSTSPCGKDVSFSAEMSATSLEIHYGLQAIQIPKSNIIFLFRDPMPEAAGPQYRTEPGEEENLNRLKRDIEAAVGKESILHYSLGWDEDKKCPTGIEENFLPKLKLFQEKLISELTWEWLACSEIQREGARQDAGFFSEGEDFACVDSCLNSLPAFDAQHRLMVFSGNKMEYCRKVAARFAAMRREEGFRVMAFEYPQVEDNYKTLYFYLSQRIADLLEMPAPEWPVDEWAPEDYIRENTKEQLKKYLSCYSKQKQEKLLLVIAGCEDDVNLAKRREEHFCLFLPYDFIDDFPMVHILRVCHNKESAFKYRMKDPYYLWTDSVTPDGRQYLEYLAKKNHKELASPVIDEMLSKYGSSSPEYLSLLFHRLMMMGADDVDFSIRDNPFLRAQYRLIQSLPTDMDELQLTILQTAARRINARFCTIVIYALGVSPDGISKEALREICEGLGVAYQPFYLRLLLQYLPDYIQETEKGIALKLAKREVVAYYLKYEDARILDEISRYYAKLVESTPKKVSSYLYFTIALTMEIQNKEEKHRLSGCALRIWRDIYRDGGRYYFRDCCTEWEMENVSCLLDIYSSDAVPAQAEEDLTLYEDIFSFLLEDVRERDAEVLNPVESSYFATVFSALVHLLDSRGMDETAAKVCEAGEKMLMSVDQLKMDTDGIIFPLSRLYGCKMNVLRQLGQPHPDEAFQKVAFWTPRLIREGNETNWWMMQRYGGQYAVLADISEKKKKEMLTVSLSQTRHGTVCPTIGKSYLYQTPTRRIFLLTLPPLRRGLAENRGSIHAAFLVEKENAIHRYVEYFDAADILLHQRNYEYAEVLCRSIAAEIEKDPFGDSVQTYYLATALWLHGLCYIGLSCPKMGNEKMEAALVLFRQLDHDVPSPLTKECLISVLYDLALTRNSSYDTMHLLEEADALLSDLLKQKSTHRWKKWKRMMQKSQKQLRAKQ